MRVHWIHSTILWLAVFIASHTPAHADEYDILVAQLIASGTNEYEDERHTVEIEDCVITTYRWKYLDDSGWTLWTSFNFHISDVRLTGQEVSTGGRYIFTPMREDPDGNIGILVIGFEGIGDTLVRHERSNLRVPTKNMESQPSPRGDGQSYYYEWRDDFFILMIGPFGQDKGRDFTLAYERISLEFCSQIG